MRTKDTRVHDESKFRGSNGLAELHFFSRFSGSTIVFKAVIRIERGINDNPSNQISHEQLLLNDPPAQTELYNYNAKTAWQLPSHGQLGCNHPPTPHYGARPLFCTFFCLEPPLHPHHPPTFSTLPPLLPAFACPTPFQAQQPILTRTSGRQLNARSSLLTTGLLTYRRGP